MNNFEQQVKLAVLLPEIARKIDQMIADAGLPRQPWSLYTWGGNRCQYIGNAPRDDVKQAMQETLDRWDEPEGPPPSRFES